MPGQAGTNGAGGAAGAAGPAGVDGPSAADTTYAVASRLAFLSQPTSTQAGQVISPAVRVAVEDAFGDVVTTDSSSITVALGANPGNGALGGNLTVTANQGVATFSNLTLDQAGTGYTLKAVDGSFAGATSDAFNVTPAPASRLVFLTPPSNTQAGQVISPAVRVAVEDSFGNLITTDNSLSTVAVGANPGNGTLSGTRTVAANSGIATFGNLSLDRAGTGYTLTAADGGLSPAISTGFTVTPGPASRLIFISPPVNAQAGQPLSPAVQVAVEDALGNVVTSNGSPVTLALAANPGNATLGGTRTVAANQGVASFSDLSLNRTGSGYTLTAAVGALPAITSGAFNVTPGAAAQLVFTVPPSDVQAGQIISPAVRVTVEDRLGNVVRSDSSPITLALGANPGGGTLSGTLTVAASNGVATFSDLSLNRAAAGYTLAAADGPIAATSGAFNVTPAPASQLAFLAQPTNTLTGQAISPAVQVAVEDGLGNVVTNDSSSVTLSVGANPGGGTLDGSVTVAASNGVATFSGLSLNKPGTGYNLTAADGSLGGATSGAFNVAFLTDGDLILSRSTVVGGQAVSLGGALSDPGSADGHQVVINWGDGSPATTLNLPAGVFTFNVSHAYSGPNPAAPPPGVFAVGVTVSDPTTGASSTAGTAVTVYQTADQAYVAQAYLDTLHRPVDTTGLGYWSSKLDQGMPRSQLATLLTHSDEYFATIIRPAYQQYLGRNADAAGLAFWTARMRQGLTDEQLEAAFIGSPEFYQQAGGTDKAWVDAMYLDLLGRTPDAAGEGYWVEALGLGAGLSKVAYGFAASPEREGQLVQQDYQTFLHRSASGGEVAYWVERFTQGVTNEDVVAGFLGSDEYFRDNT
jgi:hypothetical protein